MSTPLPFSDFLLLLRQRGYDVGIEQYKDVARLCETLGAEAARDRRLLSRSLAAVLSGCSKKASDLNREKKAREIESLFFEHYALAIKDDEELTRSQPEAIQKGLLREGLANLQAPRARRWKPALSVAIGIVLLVGVGVFVSRKYISPRTPVTPSQPAAPTPTMGQGTNGQNGAPTKPGVTPPAPTLPRPDLGPDIVHHHWLRAASVALPAPLVVFLLLYAFIRRRRLRGWAKEYWREVRNELGGAEEVSIDFGKLLPPALNRGDLEDMATILGRSEDRPSNRELDGEKTIRATLAKGTLPQLVYRRQPTARTVLLLCDVSSDMRPWNRRSEALIDGLRRRSVPLVMRYFDGQAERVSERPHGPRQPLSQVQKLYPDAALLVLSAGVGATAYDREDLSRLAPWLTVCQKYRLRVWLHPVLNRKRWRQVLKRRDFPLRVLPMSRKGLLAAAYDLAQEPERRRHIAQADASPERAATSADEQRLKQLLPLWPDAPLELGAYLLHKFCPGAPEETLLRVLAASREASGQRLRFTEEEMSRWLTELQDSEKHLLKPNEIQQRLEEQARRELLRVLRQHEPAERNGTEHMQWRLRCALQQLYLHDADDHNVKAAMATLAELAQGPLWEDVAEAMASLGVPLYQQPKGKPTRALAAPVQEKLQAQVLGLIRATAGGKVVVPRGGSGTAQPTVGQSRPGVFHRPGRWELVPTLLVLLLCMAGVYQRGTWKDTIPHEESYQIQRKGSTDSPEAELVITAQRASTPTKVSLCRNATCREADTELLLGGEGVRQIVKREREDRSYHVRARLPSGAWAYSKQILVPGYQPPVMGELLVHFTAEGHAVGRVPFTAIDAGGKGIEGVADEKLRLRIGAVRVVGEHKPYQPFSIESEVRANAVQTVSLDLGKPVQPGAVKPATGFVKVRLIAQADGRPLGGLKWTLSDAKGKVSRATSAGQELEVLSGPVQIRVDDPGYEAQLKQIVVRAGEHATVDVLLTAHRPPLLTRSEEFLKSLRYPTPSQLLSVLPSPSVDEAVPPRAGLDHPLPDMSASDARRAVAVGEMIKILGGSFLMGSEDGDDDEKPAHNEQVATFWMDKYEVTMEQYAECVKAVRCTKPGSGSFCNANQPGKEKHPANCVSWNDARQYCHWVGKRVPSENEWEYAAKGPQAKKYPWGDDDPTKEPCWNRSEGTCAVGSKPQDKSWAGIMDLGGNVLEWVQDAWRVNYSPMSPTNSALRVVRGAAWFDRDPGYLRGANRGGLTPTYRGLNVGFRCARTE